MNHWRPLSSKIYIKRRQNPERGLKNTALAVDFYKDYKNLQDIFIKIYRMIETKAR
jgi:hypothetical protein